MRLFFLTIPKPLKQYTLLKKIIHSALPSGLEALRAGSGGVDSPSRRLIYKCLQSKLFDLSNKYVLTFYVIIIG
jgi:hypothetical protein